MIASVLIAITLGGSVETATIPPSFANLQNPGTIAVSHDLSALAAYYNTTLSDLGARNFTGVSFLLETFHFVNIPPAVNATAQLANSDLNSVSISAENASRIFSAAEKEILKNEFVNATILTEQGCALATQASQKFADFTGPRTSNFQSDKIPVNDYSVGESSAAAVVGSLVSTCNLLLNQLQFQGLELLIASPQASIETGGRVSLLGNLTFRGSGVGSETVYFYINGSYFGSLSTAPNGGFSGTLQIPFVYTRTASVQALVSPNIPRNISGASSNLIYFTILFNQTAIAIGDPPPVLPTFSFPVSGTLKTVTGVPLPGAPVNLTFFRQSQILTTDVLGRFSTRLTVPANATDGIYAVTARFAPEGVFGPSFNFTSIMVVHMPIVVTVDPLSLTLAGFSSTLIGTAVANGSSVAGAAIRVVSPWGTVDGTTNSNGGFRVILPVSPTEFAFSRNVTVYVNATQPYFAIGTVTKPLGLFNVLIVIFPVAALGVVGYEAERFGVFAALRRGSRSQEERFLEEEYFESGGPPAEAWHGTEAGRVYRRALALASSKYLIRFRPSFTLREIAGQVRAKDPGRGGDLFAQVMGTVEDAAYAKGFEESRLAAAAEAVAVLERLWK